MAKEATILRSELFLVAEQAIGLGLERFEVVEGYLGSGTRLGPRSLPFI